MRIILTHEQADFDALASLLGAYLLNDASIPVLPRRMNRNVRAFLTLYGGDLPFVDPRDLPGEPIDSVILVDTQSMISIKGMEPDVRVHVIDHHPLKDDLPKNWNLTISGTGANTTVFIDTIRERDVLLSAIQATLLLLGIYEDTGSLTYTRTTARDLRAASYLLEQGASLQIAADFLNHPLSSSQQALYDRLRDNAEYHHIQGHTVIIVCGDAQSVDEELSTIAHKLRDVLDSDAIFLLITTRGGVQFIARSTTDNIDVSEVASFFGGGGHERAAAGLIKDRELDEIHAELIEILNRTVRPAVMVAQLMSSSPQLLNPQTPVDEVARRMQRYGYEGYPVVENGKVVGLLTRRAVDRAISHKLNLTARQLMDAGEYTVEPQDSLETLQDRMTDSGWGQIPVVHPSSGQIIGIVTRTDLIKTLTPRPRVPSRQNLADRLMSALPASRLILLKAVAEEAHQEGAALYIVGGFVRDLLLDRPSQDFDLVVEGDAIALAKALSRRYGGRVTSHGRFGTAKWFIDSSGSFDYSRLASDRLHLTRDQINADEMPDTLDFVTARTEFYTYPTALPTVERGSIKLDLHRRDFTINTLAMRLDGHHYGELHDYWGGLNDLRQGIVRVLHSLSFVDDPTRILRAVRFEQRFGFRIEKRTLDLLREARSLLERISGDRIRHELNTILVEKRVSQILSRLQELRILSVIHPDLVWDEWLHGRIERLASTRPPTGWLEMNDGDDPPPQRDLIMVLWLLRFSPGIARDIAIRLKLPSGLIALVESACLLWPQLNNLLSARPSQVARRLDGVPAQAIYAVYLASDISEVKRVLDRYMGRWRKQSASIDGNDLRAMGLKPGPIYREILNSLRDAWLDGLISSSQEEKMMLQELIEMYQNGRDG